MDTDQQQTQQHQRISSAELIETIELTPTWEASTGQDFAPPIPAQHLDHNTPPPISTRASPVEQGSGLQEYQDNDSKSSSFIEKMKDQVNRSLPIAQDRARCLSTDMKDEAALLQSRFRLTLPKALGGSSVESLSVDAVPQEYWQEMELLLQQQLKARQQMQAADEALGKLLKESGVRQPGDFGRSVSAAGDAYRKLAHASAESNGTLEKKVVMPVSTFTTHAMQDCQVAIDAYERARKDVAIQTINLQKLKEKGARKQDKADLATKKLEALQKEMDRLGDTCNVKLLMLEGT
eukprot:gene25597-31287_t